jgi:hypothetical protein
MPHPPSKEIGFSPQERPSRLYLFGVNRSRLEDAAKERQMPLEITSDLKNANLLLTTRNYYRRKPQIIRNAESSGMPIYVLKSNNLPHMRQCLSTLYPPNTAPINQALVEAKEAITRLSKNKQSVELSPQGAYIRRLQHILARQHNFVSQSFGKEPKRRVVFSRKFQD